MNIDEAKNSKSNYIKYKLKYSTVYSGAHGYTFSNYLDPDILNKNNFKLDANKLLETREYLNNQLQSNFQRYSSQVNKIKEYLESESKVLDVGCGGGLFLKLLQRIGFKVFGVELEPYRKEYCIQNGISIFNEDITKNDFIKIYNQSFDAVTLWDVIEHVNYPSSQLKAAFNILKKGGYIFIDTPAKDGFYHKLGSFLYSHTKGRFNFFLDIMYSDHMFGHKQIFSTIEMEKELKSAGFEIKEISKFHELSFPYEFYLKKLLKSNFLVKLFKPIISLLLIIFPIKNKMLVVAKKPI
jgi:2-polyprenyl-3-methyl-5-hydroxy-6-metoxy-1,4-benzoquinol methylase